ncbi:glycosyltransferase family 2 protein [Haloarcula marina]|uniref:glycosyltransferase family 2 protein n=1 Tax=Haloarcula marina TaxID=2961574 RepID=UPI0020B756EF|nr:glycosyltransferase family 2 protein [Halomicroarcula marina]
MSGTEPTEQDPTVSVVVTTYERPERCKRALRSVLAQTHDPAEIIVVEDASDTDLEAWVAREIPSATYVRHETNEGLAAARNTGLRLASGAFVAYLDDDDEWKPTRLEQQLERVRTLEPRESLGVVYCGVERRTPDGETRSIALPENSGDLASSIRAVGASTLPSTCLFRTAALRDVGGFDESLPSSIDHDIWMQLAVAGYAAEAIAEPLTITYVSDRAQMTTDTESRIEGVRLYLEKWLPTYREWFGEAAGSAYAERYFARVVGRLAGKKFVSGNFSEFLTATRAIFAFSTQHRYNCSVLATYIGRYTASRLLPTRAIVLLKRHSES